MLAGVAVLTRLITTTAKSSSQGTHDLHGANRVIFTEEFMFLPAYAFVRALGLGDYAAVVAALLVADLATSTFAWTRLVRRGFFHSAERPSPSLVASSCVVRTTRQVGGIMTQLNLRLDFIILGVLAGPAVPRRLCHRVEIRRARQDLQHGPHVRALPALRADRAEAGRSPTPAS
jgi:hypothetical protein